MISKAEPCSCCLLEAAWSDMDEAGLWQSSGCWHLPQCWWVHGGTPHQPIGQSWGWEAVLPLNTDQHSGHAFRSLHVFVCWGKAFARQFQPLTAHSGSVPAPGYKHVTSVMLLQRSWSTTWKLRAEQEISTSKFHCTLSNQLENSVEMKKQQQIKLASFEIFFWLYVYTNICSAEAQIQGLVHVR